MHYSGYVGRVGGLAVALGVGSAVLLGTGCGTASAETPSGSTGSGTSDTSPKSESATTHSAPTTDSAPSGQPARPGSRLRTAVRDALGAIGRDDSAPRTARNAKKPPSSLSESRALSSTRAPVRPKRAERSVADLPRAVASEVRDVAATVARPEPRRISLEVDDILNPLSVNKVPDAPPATPAVWTMLAAARREFDRPAKPPRELLSSALVERDTVTSADPPVTANATTTPLGTPDQLAAERLATQIMGTVPVQAMKIVLGAGFLVAGYQNFAPIGGPDWDNIGQLWTAVDEYTRQAAMEQQLLDSMNPKVLQQVMPPHTWGGQTVGGSRILYDNPDTVYRMMGVNHTSSYVITGQFPPDPDPVTPGNQAIPADTNFSVLTGLNGTTADNINGDDLIVDEDGRFVIYVDSGPKTPGTNHLYVPPEATLVVARNTLSDWENQQPMTLEIVRVDGPPASLFSQFGGFAIPGLGPLVSQNDFLTDLVSVIPPMASPPPLLLGAETAVVMALGLMMEPEYMAVATKDPAGEFKEPNVFTDPTRNAEFLATQVQSAGYFDLPDDEALVLVIDPGDAEYFVVPVTNDWTITDNYWDRQTSLNNAQAVANADGTYTIIVSKNDPGVANWVSTGGLDQGTISIRFQDLPEDSENLPKVTSYTVPLDELPPGMATVTPEQRDAQLAARKAAYYKRYAPFPAS